MRFLERNFKSRCWRGCWRVICGGGTEVCRKQLSAGFEDCLIHPGRPRPRLPRPAFGAEGSCRSPLPPAPPAPALPAPGQRGLGPRGAPWGRPYMAGACPGACPGAVKARAGRRGAELGSPRGDAASAVLARGEPRSRSGAFHRLAGWCRADPPPRSAGPGSGSLRQGWGAPTVAAGTQGCAECGHGTGFCGRGSHGHPPRSAALSSVTSVVAVSFVLPCRYSSRQNVF